MTQLVGNVVVVGEREGLAQEGVTMVTIKLSEDSADILGIILDSHSRELEKRLAEHPAMLAGALGDVEAIRYALETALAVAE